MIFVKIDENLYPAIIDGKAHDREWDDREIKTITLNGSYSTISNIFKDGTKWSMVDKYEVEKFLENGELELINGGPVFEEKSIEYDNSEFNILGDIIVHMDGTCTVKMGKETDEEKLLLKLYGGI